MTRSTRGITTSTADAGGHDLARDTDGPAEPRESLREWAARTAPNVTDWAEVRQCAALGPHTCDTAHARRWYKAQARALLAHVREINETKKGNGT